LDGRRRAIGVDMVVAVVVMVMVMDVAVVDEMGWWM
jgi:hypothetical protein